MNEKLQELDVLIRAVPYYTEIVDKAYEWINKDKMSLVQKETDRIVEEYTKLGRNPFDRLYGGISKKVQDLAWEIVEEKLSRGKKQYAIDKGKIYEAIGERLVEIFPELKPECMRKDEEIAQLEKNETDLKEKSEKSEN